MHMVAIKTIFLTKIPTGAVFILRTGAFGAGIKHYNKHMNFLPLVSSPAINPSIWANNNIYFNTKKQKPKKWSIAHGC
jgi:hypothetical protein